MSEDRTQDFPYRDTIAAQLLTDALRRQHYEGTSLRKLAQRLGYKQAVVLSHMANGRVPIPVERSIELAGVLGIAEAPFVDAVLRQRYPNIKWGELLASASPPPGSAADFVWSIEVAAGRSVDELSPDQLRVMREVAASPNPARRWLSVHEVSVIEMLRRVRPNLSSEGLDRADVSGIEALLE